jgi:hypothetical protein
MRFAYWKPIKSPDVLQERAVEGFGPRWQGTVEVVRSPRISQKTRKHTTSESRDKVTKELLGASFACGPTLINSQPRSIPASHRSNIPAGENEAQFEQGRHSTSCFSTAIMFSFCLQFRIRSSQARDMHSKRANAMRGCLFAYGGRYVTHFDSILLAAKDSRHSIYLTIM